MTIRTVAPSPGGVQAALAGLPVHDMHVTIARGIVTLTGVAPCYNTKHAATARIEAALPGVRVVNELRVAQPAVRERALASVVRDAVRACTDAEVRVAVRDGYVTVRGAAPNEATRRRIEAAAWQAAAGFNVRTVISSGVVVDDREIEEALAEYMRRAMSAEARAITVRYRRGVVTLRGSVASAAQGQAIEDLLRWHDRVEDVVNQLQVAPAGAGPAAGEAS
jgi:osmotically-inducible protein OsmY